MHKILLCLSLLLSLSSALIAQDNSRAAIFGGYQFLHLNGQGVSENANGWDAAVNGNITKYFGVTGDFSGAYKSISGASGHAYTYTFGPTATVILKGKLNPFVHVLLGGTSVGGSLTGGGSGSNSGFAMFLGGGVDAKVDRSISVRVVQFDWLHYSVSGVSGSSNVRLCFGAVLHL